MDPPDREPDDNAVAGAPPDAPGAASEPDLERIAGDLADVERALERLGDGSYWTDEITGEPIPDGQLAEDPTARRAAFVAPAGSAGPAGAPAPGAGDQPPDA